MSSFTDSNLHHAYQDEYQNVYDGPTSPRRYAAPDAHANVSSSPGFNTQGPLDASALHPAPRAAPQTVPSSTAYNATHPNVPNLSMNSFPSSSVQDDSARPPFLFEPFYPNPQSRRDAYDATVPRPQQLVYDNIPQPHASGSSIPKPATNTSSGTIPQPQTNASTPRPGPTNISSTTIPRPPTNSSNTTIPQPPPNTTPSTTSTMPPQPIPSARPDTSTTTSQTSTTIPTSPPHTRASEPQQGSVPPKQPSAIPAPPTFMPPLDLGPSATYEDAVTLWHKLSPEDHLFMVNVHIEKERRLAESARLFTIGSAGPKSSGVNAKNRKSSRQARRSRSTTRGQGFAQRDHPQNTASQPATPAVNTSTARPPTAVEQPIPPPTDAHPASTTIHPPPAPRKPFKTVRVEDYHSESDDESESDQDAARIPSHAKGKGRTVEPEVHSPTPELPTLNPRPNVAPVQNRGSPFSAVLNAFHTMNERMDRLELSVTQGMKQMDAKLSDVSAEPPVIQTPQIPTARMTRTQSTVARMLAGRDTSRTSRRAATGTRVPTRFGYATVPEQPVPPVSTAHPPNFNYGWAGVPTHTHAAFAGAGSTAQAGFHPLMSNQVPPPSGGVEAGGQRNTQTSTSLPIPPVFGGRFSTPQGPHLSPSNQVPHGVDGGVTGPSHTHLQSGPSAAVSPMTEEQMSENMKLYRKYVRRHLWEQLFDIKGVEQLRERCPRIPDDEYEKYLRIKGRVINASNFRIDFTRGWERCKFNKEARSFFAHHFVSSVRGGMYQNPPLPDNWITVDMSAEVLDTVIVHIFRGYSEQSKPPTLHNQAKSEMTKERKRANTRRETLLKWRIETLAKLNLERHLVLFANMTPAHLSGDEAAVGSDLKHSHYRLFYIIEAAWQSRAFRNFVRDLDKWYIYFSRPKVGATQRGGNRPRIREELPKGKARVVDSIAPRGLWRNCYDEDWLNALKVCEREELGMIDEDYDFSLPTPPPLPVEVQPARAATQNNSSFPYSSTFGSSGGGQSYVPGSSIHTESTMPAASTSTMHEPGRNPANASAAVSDRTTCAPTAPSTT